MRILHLLNHIGEHNGNVHVAVDLACVQAGMGHQVCVVSGGGTFEPLLQKYKVEHIRIDFRLRPIGILRTLPRLRKAIAAFRPDIVHAHMMTSALLASFVRPFEKFRLVTTVHNEFEKSAIVMAVGDRVIAVSQAVADSMEKRGTPRSKLRVVINGTTGTPRLSAQLPTPQTLNHPAITFVGGLHPRKGVADLIDAFKIVCETNSAATLYLVGSGPYESKYRRRAAETGHGQRIVFCGPQPDPRTYLLASELFVLASLAEPGALVIAEARAAGCAVIATRVGGNAQMLDGGGAGLLVPPASPGQLAEAIVRVLGDPALLADLRLRAAKNSEYFNIERAARDYLTVYAELLSRP